MSNLLDDDFHGPGVIAQVRANKGLKGDPVLLTLPEIAKALESAEGKVRTFLRTLREAEENLERDQRLPHPLRPHIVKGVGRVHRDYYHPGDVKRFIRELTAFRRQHLSIGEFSTRVGANHRSVRANISRGLKLYRVDIPVFERVIGTPKNMYYTTLAEVVQFERKMLELCGMTHPIDEPVARSLRQLSPDQAGSRVAGADVREGIREVRKVRPSDTAAPGHHHLG